MTIKKMHISRSALTLIGVVAVTVLVTALTIYVTPLKHFNLIAPVMNEVDPRSLYAAYQKTPQDYIFIDVRSPNVYESAHAQGAINIPIENMYDEHYSLPHTGKKIVLICTTGRLAAIAYGYLEDWGYTNLLHVQGGLDNWVQEGLPVDGKNIPASLTGQDDHQ